MFKLLKLLIDLASGMLELIKFISALVILWLIGFLTKLYQKWFKR